ncbi:MAG: type I restriction enzyme HsdR N-terminal domain-containing protein [Bacteroidia bacterium]|nr:type I restriction enzyme HsdR N-terminal domain-containing protein [Bacteroidia bacterium]
MPVNKQIVNSIKKSLTKFDFTNLEERCTNEAQTRFTLIEPLLEVLGYSRIDDMATEINAGWGQKNDKADIGLIVKGKIPEIIVECKTLNKRLTDKEASQLNGYFINTKNSKFGILTNGLEWRFYFPNDATKEMKLFNKPFQVINFDELDEQSIEFLSLIHKNNIDLKEIHEFAQDFFFEEGFIDAFQAELLDPSDKFIEAIFGRMHGKRLTDQLKTKLRAKINSKTLQEILPNLIEEESKSGNFVITTAEELKIYHAVKTLLLNSIKKLDAGRISYRDQKNSFNIIVDENNKKIIAKITSSRNKYVIEINGDKFDANNIENIVALKKPLVEIAQQYFESSPKS